jgi:hypothetical protein
MPDSFFLSHLANVGVEDSFVGLEDVKEEVRRFS